MNADVHPPASPHRDGPPQRGPVRRALETRGWVGGFDRRHHHVRVRATDGTPLAATWLPTEAASDAAVVVVHGFAANRRKPSYVRLAEHLADAGRPVLTVDLRGHGGSGGRCTFGHREAADVAGAVRWLRTAGHGHVTVVGASMGATAALGAAAARGLADRGVPTRPDAVAVISAPAWYRDPPDTEPLRRLHALWSSPMARAALRHGLGVDLAGPAAWDDPPHPVDLAAQVEVPALAVHGVDDAYFPPGDADALAAASGGVVWHEPAGFGHAEDGFHRPFLDRLAVAVTAVALDGRFPSG